MNNTIKLYKVTKKNTKTKARGFWYDKNGNKTYYDYIEPEKTKIDNLPKMKAESGEIALFYIKDDQGHIYYGDKTDILPYRIILKHKGYKGLKVKIKWLLNQYEGLTIFKANKYYKIELFSNQKFDKNEVKSFLDKI